MSHSPLHELQPILPDHPHVRAALWHLDGLRQPGMSPELWLTDRERAEVSGYGHERRRREWLAARIALKRLLMADELVRSPFHAEIRKNSEGQPRIVIYVPETGYYAEMTCSLAHKNQQVAVVYSRHRVRVGIDIERRSWRLPYLRGRFESPSDRMLDSADSIAQLTVLWSFKEAVSKLLGLGFACGFTQIGCRETRHGACELLAPGDLHLHGLYMWNGRYAIAVVTDLPHEKAGAPEDPRPSSRPWFEQLSRAQRLRRIRRARALGAPLPVLPCALPDFPEEEEASAAATEGTPPPQWR